MDTSHWTMDPTFLDALRAETSALQTAHPLLRCGLDKAFALVASGAVFPEDDGTSAMVQSQSDPTQHHSVNGSCDCKAAQYHQAPCAHRLALRLYQKVCDRCVEDTERWTVDLEPSTQVQDVAPVVKAEYLVQIQGRPFVRFEGLLAMAHERGLVTLETTMVSVSEVLAVCQSTAVFRDGRRFTDIGDATERNVPKHLAPHFIRMAATRASARALRRALNLNICSLEELDGSEVTHG
jgi:hypothetical protein